MNLSSNVNQILQLIDLQNNSISDAPQLDHETLRACKRDTVDMMEFVEGCPVEFQEYYIQMQAAKRSDVPLPLKMKDEIMTIDMTMGDQINRSGSSIMVCILFSQKKKLIRGTNKMIMLQMDDNSEW